VKIVLNEAYAEKWNERSTDFGHLYLDGKQVSEKLFRIGGVNGSGDEQYTQLIRYDEAYYDNHIAKDLKDKRHLESVHCIVDSKGEVKVVFETLHHGYLCGGQLYSIGTKFYNIESGEYYGDGSSVESGEFLFLKIKYHEDNEMIGVWKINKIDGTKELFPSE
jgi:hypothetical protein